MSPPCSTRWVVGQIVARLYGDDATQQENLSALRAAALAVDERAERGEVDLVGLRVPYSSTLLRKPRSAWLSKM